jgi:uncharacterized protein YcgL (UPF0745 family)
MKVICSVYRSPKKEGMYLYVEKQEGLERVPETLLKQFGNPQMAMTLVLTPEKKLALADVEKVLEALQEQGFYLQMPPRPDQAMSSIHARNNKMGL